MSNTYKYMKDFTFGTDHVVLTEEVECCTRCDCEIPPDTFQVPCDYCVGKSNWTEEHEG